MYNPGSTIEFREALEVQLDSGKNDKRAVLIVCPSGFGDDAHSRAINNSLTYPAIEPDV
jgi:hypothetical protein